MRLARRRRDPGSGEEVVQGIHHHRARDSGRDARHDEIHRPSNARVPSVGRLSDVVPAPRRSDPVGMDLAIGIDRVAVVKL